MDLNSRADGANIPLSTVEPEMTAEAGTQNGRLDTNPTSGFSEDLRVSPNLIWVRFPGHFENTKVSTKEAVAETKAEEQLEKKGKNKSVTQNQTSFSFLFFKITHTQ